MVSIFDLSRCRSSMIGRAVKAESMAATSSELRFPYCEDAHRLSLEEQS